MVDEYLRMQNTTRPAVSGHTQQRPFMTESMVADMIPLIGATFSKPKTFGAQC